MLDDYLEPEVMIAVAVTAAVASPPVRKVLRKGLVYGLAGLMTVGDRVAGAARNLAAHAPNLGGTAAHQTVGQGVEAAT
jgi:hypothetical protein